MVATPSLVPVPASLIPGDPDEPAFVFTDDTALSGEGDAMAVLRALLAARGIHVGDERRDGGRDVSLAIDGEGPAESYRMQVRPHAIAIHGADAAGLFYGIQTLDQLIPTDAAPAVPTLRIEDSPRFGYRGVMLDVARHFHPVETIEAFIDRAAALKFNALHLHLSDDQGWRLEIRSRPLLTERAAATAVGGAPGGFFDQDDYRRIVAHAAAKHMIVVPEIDVPGHTHAVSLAYPELAEQPVLADHVHATIAEFGGSLPVHGEPYEGIAVGFSSLAIRDEATYDFLRDVLGEVVALTPGPYVHVGGDEALGTEAADFAHIMSRTTQLVADLGKVPVTWHEAGAATGLAPGTVGQYWGFVEPADGADDKARAFVTAGGSVILSPADAVYLDMKPAPDFPLGLTWARGATSVRRAYAWEPAEVIDGLGDDGILGVEAPLWTETVADLADIDALAYPRIAAAAETAWSPRTGPERNADAFIRRVAALAPLWRSRGVTLAPLAEVPW